MLAILHGDEQHGLERLYQHATKINSLSAPLYGLALARSAFSPVADHVYLDRPNILSLHHRVKPTESGGFVGSISIDIVANYVATLPGLDSHEARLTQGVVDTTAESLFVTGCRECGQVSNVSRIWTLSQKAGVTWFPVRSARELASKDLKLQDDVRKRIEQDLSAGYTVILPSQPVGVDSQPQLGWWRVRTQSGETLGVMASGEGQAMVEYIKSKAAVVGAVFFLGTLLDCMGSVGKAGFVKAAACLGCSWQAGYGLVSIMQRVGTVMLTNLTPAVVGKLVTVGFVCLIANLM
jgi:hypothetical protein